MNVAETPQETLDMCDFLADEAMQILDRMEAAGAPRL
jgi:hypothetical protein